jgi:hypothetical protein
MQNVAVNILKKRENLYFFGVAEILVLQASVADDILIWIRIWILGSISLTVRIRILLFLSLNFKMPTKNLYLLKSFLCLLLFEGTWTAFSKIKSQKEVTKQ